MQNFGARYSAIRKWYWSQRWCCHDDNQGRSNRDWCGPNEYGYNLMTHSLLYQWWLISKICFEFCKIFTSLCWFSKRTADVQAHMYLPEHPRGFQCNQNIIQSVCESMRFLVVSCLSKPHGLNAHADFTKIPTYRYSTVQSTRLEVIRRKHLQIRSHVYTCVCCQI